MSTNSCCKNARFHLYCWNYYFLLSFLLCMALDNGPGYVVFDKLIIICNNLRITFNHCWNFFNHFIYFIFSEHFPYFKTAPTGWKNSVRHNLSLNKCFEKIEKPSANGTNQRKGCLWAMNPAKIQKMDEEVAKWSRKDPMAIKKGMVHPRKCF